MKKITFNIRYGDIPQRILASMMNDLPKTGLSVWREKIGDRVIEYCCCKRERVKSDIYDILVQ